MEKKNSLLIVDDDTAILTELIHILQKEYNIYTAKDGITALERAEKSLPDLILLDIILPDMNGFEVLSKLKKSDNTKDIPVLFITGASESDKESEGLAIGAVDYIRKPFDNMVVKLRIHHQIKIINLQRDLESSAKAAEMASQTKSAFLAHMSHEIRTPMNAILGITEILIQKENLKDDIEEGLDKIYTSCCLLLGIINDVLDFSKIEAGKLEIKPAEYKLASMINDSVLLNMMRINSKPIEFELSIDENLPEVLIGDELRIKQILNNLLSNAFKYTEEGNVTLSVGIEAAGCKPMSDNKDVYLLMKVQDTGHGMTEEQVGKMFDEYTCFHQKSGKTVEGTGLGMAIVQSLINLIGGEIHVESKPGVGSFFSIKLLQQKVNDKVLGKEAAENLQQFRMRYMTNRKREQIARDPMPYGKVLVVDDVETNIYVAVGLMKLYGLQIDTAKSGHEAIDIIKSGKVYDVIFMDHMMPEMDGMETTKHLRDMGYTSSIVVLTANAVSGQADIFLHSGFDEFISKPIDIRQLNSILNKLVRDKHPAEAMEEARNKAQNAGSADSNSSLNLPAQADSMLQESFIKDARKALEWLEENLHKISEKEILRKFTIIVHGIKSSLWNIGETSLADFAYKLEADGRENNTELIKASVPSFANELHTLLKKLKAKRNDNSINAICTSEDIEKLKSSLLAIQKMCADYNRKGALDILADIKNCSKETKIVLDNIMDSILHSEFEEAEDAAKKYTDSIKEKVIDTYASTSQN